MEQLQRITQEIDRQIIHYLKKRNNLSYENRLKEAIDILLTILKKEEIKDLQNIIEEIKTYSSYIQSAVNLYLQGHLQESFAKMKDILKQENKKQGPTATKYSAVYTIRSGIHIYRGRVNSEKRYKKVDLFHVPITNRGKVSTMRFSIPGYPCLYMAASPYCCWRELNNPAEFTIASIKVKYDVPVLDMRFCVKSANIDDLLGYIVFYPFRIACSIPVPTKNSNDQFKIEYIIPQILLHTSIIERASNRFKGIITTSTKYFQRSNLFNTIRDADNIIVPMQSVNNDKINNDGHCKQLSEWFSVNKLYDSIRDDTYSKGYWDNILSSLEGACQNK